MPIDTDGMTRPSAPSADVVVLIDRLDTALEDRDFWRKREREARERDEVGQAALKAARSEAAAALAIAERAQRECDEARAANNSLWKDALSKCQRLERSRDEACTWARRLYAHNRELTRDMLTAFPFDSPGTCEDCAVPLECVRPGKVQRPDCE